MEPDPGTSAASGDLAMRVRELVVVTDAYRQAAAARLGVGVTEATVMGELLHRGPLTPSALGVRVGLTSPSVTGLVDRMEAAGVAVRVPNPADRRSVLVGLTDVGHHAITRAFADFADDVQGAVERSGAAHVRELAELLGRVADALRAAPPGA